MQVQQEWLAELEVASYNSRRELTADSLASILWAMEVVGKKQKWSPGLVRKSSIGPPLWPRCAGQKRPHAHSTRDVVCTPPAMLVAPPSLGGWQYRQGAGLVAWEWWQACAAWQCTGTPCACCCMCLELHACPCHKAGWSTVGWGVTDCRWPEAAQGWLCGLACGCSRVAAWAGSPSGQVHFGRCTASVAELSYTHAVCRWEISSITRTMHLLKCQVRLLFFGLIKSTQTYPG